MTGAVSGDYEVLVVGSWTKPVTSPTVDTTCNPADSVPGF